jgi:hypothetical protein
VAALAGMGQNTFAQTRRVFTVPQNFAEPADPARELFNAGQRFYDQYRFADAERTFREVIQKYPKSNIADRAEYYLIRTLAQSGKQAEAVERIDAFPKSYPKSAWNADAQEIKIQLTNQIPPKAVAVLVRTPQVPPAPPAPPTPFAVATPVVARPFGTQNLDPQITLQQEVMRAMFFTDAARAIQIAMDRLKSDMNDPLVLSSMNMIAFSGLPQAVPLFVDVARRSPNLRARKDAIFWMTQAASDKDAIVDTLMGLLPTSNDEDSDAVAFALGQIHTDKAFNALATIARDKHRTAKARASALRWIGQSQSPQAASTLEAVATTDSDITLRTEAVRWLSLMRTADANQALENILRKK